MVAEATEEGKAAMREAQVLRGEIVEWKALAFELKAKNSSMRSMVIEKNNQIESLQGQFHVCGERVDLAQGEIAKLKFKNGMIIVIGSAMIVGAGVAAVYFATQ